MWKGKNEFIASHADKRLPFHSIYTGGATTGITKSLLVFQRKLLCVSFYCTGNVRLSFALSNSVNFRVWVLDTHPDVLLLNHHVKKGKQCLHDGTVMIDLDQESLPLDSRLWCSLCLH